VPTAAAAVKVKIKVIALAQPDTILWRRRTGNGYKLLPNLTLHILLINAKSESFGVENR